MTGAPARRADPGCIIREMDVVLVSSTHALMRQYSRREFLTVASSATGALAVGCSLDTPAPILFTHQDAMITARPGTPTLTPTPGYSALGLSTPRDGLLYVPTTYNPATPAPLLVLLHDGGTSAQFWEDAGVGQLLDDLGVVIMAPDSRHADWDLFLTNGYRDDPAFINIALAWLFQRCNINASRIALGGFGNGASESFGLGFANGNLFTHVIGFSPNVLYAPFLQGKPKVMISHGTSDSVFSFEYTKSNIVARLQDAQYSVDFVEYSAGHVLPSTITRQAIEWFLA